MGALPPVEASGASFVRGDANADGDVDISDAVTILIYLFSTIITPPCPDACDTNDVEGINLTDAVYLLDFLFRAEGTAPPPPYPEPGPDPTNDDSFFCPADFAP